MTTPAVLHGSWEIKSGLHACITNDLLIYISSPKPELSMKKIKLEPLSLFLCENRESRRSVNRGWNPLYRGKITNTTSLLCVESWAGCLWIDYCNLKILNY